MVYGLSYGAILYLLAAIHIAEGNLEQQLDTAAVRKELGFEDREGRENVPGAERLLAFRGMITSRGAGRINKTRFFWITEKGLEAAIEARKQGYSWPPKH